MPPITAPGDERMDLGDLKWSRRENAVVGERSRSEYI